MYSSNPRFINLNFEEDRAKLSALSSFFKLSKKDTMALAIRVLYELREKIVLEDYWKEGEDGDIVVVNEKWRIHGDIK